MSIKLLDYRELDPKISSLVRALHRIGVATWMSCEGHTDNADRCPFPWVAILYDDSSHEAIGNLFRVLSEHNRGQDHKTWWTLYPETRATSDGTPLLFLRPLTYGNYYAEGVLEHHQKSASNLASLLDKLPRPNGNRSP